MKCTSSELAKLLRSLKEAEKLILSNERKSMFFSAALSEDIEEIRPEYEYKKLQEELMEIGRKIRVIKHALNCFNVSTRLPGMDITIDQALVYLPQLTARKEKLDKMQKHLARERVEDRWDRSRSMIAEYEFANYDLNQVREDYKKVNDELTAVQNALDRVNITELIEVDF